MVHVERGIPLSVCLSVCLSSNNAHSSELSNVVHAYTEKSGMGCIQLYFRRSYRHNCQQVRGGLCRTKGLKLD